MAHKFFRPQLGGSPSISLCKAGRERLALFYFLARETTLEVA